jgi:hypothetical protein
MRILANYGHKINGSSFNVTFEQTGDVPMERAEETIDLLFKLAREAVQRQVEEDMEFPPKDVVTIPKPKNINGNPQMRDPEGPATGKQKFLLLKLARQRSKFIENIEELSKAEASSLINELMAV